MWYVIILVELDWILPKINGRIILEIVFWKLCITELGLHWWWSNPILSGFSIQSLRTATLSYLFVFYFSCFHRLSCWNSNSWRLVQLLNNAGLIAHVSDHDSLLRPLNWSFQFGLPCPLTGDAQTEDKLVELCGEVWCNDREQMNLTSPFQEIWLGVIGLCKDTLQSDMQVESVSEQCRLIPFHDCRGGILYPVSLWNQQPMYISVILSLMPIIIAKSKRIYVQKEISE